MTEYQIELAEDTVELLQGLDDDDGSVWRHFEERHEAGQYSLRDMFHELSICGMVIERKDSKGMLEFNIVKRWLDTITSTLTPKSTGE
jgi:hypothetical protein